MLSRRSDDYDDTWLAILQALLAAGADPNQVLCDRSPYLSKFEAGGGPLHVAIDQWRSTWPENSEERLFPSYYSERGERVDRFVETAIRMLLDAGANPNLRRPRDGQTPLHIAARHGSLKLTQLLLERGADVRIADNSGYTALTEVIFAPKAPDEIRDEIISFYERYLSANHITIMDPSWQHRRRDRFLAVLGRFLLFLAYLAVPLVYTAGSIYLRERHYRARPQDNWLGTIHAYLTVIGGSMLLTITLVACLLAEWFSGGDLMLAVLGFVVSGLAVGLPAGLLAMRYGHMAKHFKRYRVLYYLDPAATLLAVVVALTYWF
jgi:hypothetical protein